MDYNDMPRFMRSNQVVRACRVKDAPDAPKGAQVGDWIVYVDHQTPVVLTDGLFRLLFAPIEG